MPYTRIPVDLLVRHARSADRIFVRYEKLSTREVRRGGMYVGGNGTYIRLRSAWQNDSKRNGEKVIFSVQINDDTSFMIDKRAAEMLEVRDRHSMIHVSLLPPPAVQSLSPPAVQSLSPLSSLSRLSSLSPPTPPLPSTPCPFLAAGYTSDLSDVNKEDETHPAVSRSYRPGSPNIDKDELYYHDDRMSAQQTSSKVYEPICISDDDDTVKNEEELVINR